MQITKLRNADYLFFYLFSGLPQTRGRGPIGGTHLWLIPDATQGGLDQNARVHVGHLLLKMCIFGCEQTHFSHFGRT